MIHKLRLVVWPATKAALFVGCAVVGIGGMGLVGASDEYVARLWQLGAGAAILTLLIGLLVYSLRVNRRQI